MLDFLKERLKKMSRSGEKNFIACHSCRGEKWHVAVMSNGVAPFIFSLVCADEKCGTELFVEQGIIKSE